MVTRRILTSLLVSVICMAALAGMSYGSDWSVLPARLKGGVAVYGDSRTGHLIHENIMDGISSIAPAAVFHTGDLVSSGTNPGHWKTFNKIISRLPPGTPFYPALGNHEKASRLFFDNFTLPGNERWYSVEIAGIHFTVLDTGSDLSPGSPQYRWLAEDLSSPGPGTKYIVAVFHHPPFSTGRHGKDQKGLKNTIVPLFERLGVDLVFSGHDHDYERSVVNGIPYIVSGGGGAPLRGQSRKNTFSRIFAREHHFCVLYGNEDGALSVDVIDEQARVIDHFRIAP